MNTRRAGRAALAGLLALASGAPAGAVGASARVRVVRADDADAILREASNRTRAELSAAGLDAAIVDCARADDRCGALPSPAGDALDAVVATTRAGDQTITEVTVVCPVAAPPLILRLTVGPESADRDDPATLAVRAAELVQSALLQARLPLPAPRPAPPSDAITYDFEQPHDHPVGGGAAGWFVGGGGAMLGGIDGFGPAFGLALRAGYAGVHWPALTVAATLAAPALGADVRFDQGRVALRQELAAAQAALRFRPRRRLQPWLSLGGGVYHLTARGIPDGAAFVGQSASIWSAMLSLGGGAAVRIGDAVSLFGELQAIVVDRYPTLMIDGRSIDARHPSFLLSMGLERFF